MRCFDSDWKAGRGAETRGDHRKEEDEGGNVQALSNDYHSKKVAYACD